MATLNQKTWSFLLLFSMNMLSSMCIQWVQQHSKLNRTQTHFEMAVMKFKMMEEKGNVKVVNCQGERSTLTRSVEFSFPCHTGPPSYCLATDKMPLLFRQETETARKLHTKLVSLQVSCTAHWCRDTWPIMKSFAFTCRPGCAAIGPGSRSCCFTESKEICTWKPHPHYLTLQLTEDCLPFRPK